jgi:hypothetical protein
VTASDFLDGAAFNRSLVLSPPAQPDDGGIDHMLRPIMVTSTFSARYQPPISVSHSLSSGFS